MLKLTNTEEKDSSKSTNSYKIERRGNTPPSSLSSIGILDNVHFTEENWEEFVETTKDDEVYELLTDTKVTADPEVADAIEAYYNDISLHYSVRTDTTPEIEVVIQELQNLSTRMTSRHYGLVCKYSIAESPLTHYSSHIIHQIPTYSQVLTIEKITSTRGSINYNFFSSCKFSINY